MEKITLTQEYQNLLYGLFQQKLFNISGTEMQNSQGMIETFVPKSELIEAAIEVLNKFGESMATDGRLENEIDT